MMSQLNGSEMVLVYINNLYSIMWSSLSVNSDRLFSPDSSTNKTDCLDITELLLKVVLNTIKLTLIIAITMWYNFQQIQINFFL